MRRLSLIVLFVALPLFGQTAPGAPVAIELNSSLMGEKRTILVRTPASYRTGARAYPVLYMTDGDRHIDHTAATVDFLAREGRIPELIIVGITNTDRTRDLTPTHVSSIIQDGRTLNFPTSGGADKFLTFVASEVIPHIEKNYRTQPYRVFAGHSFGGLFALHTLVSRPDLFNAVIAVSPALIWDDQYVLRRTKELLTSRPELNRTLIFTVGDEGEALDREFRGLEKLFKGRVPKGFEYQAIKFAGEDHGSVVLPSHYAGLRKVFDAWRFPLDGDVKTVFARARDHYRRLSQRAGFDVPIPEPTTNLIGYRLLQQKQVTEAIEVFKANVEAFPQSANVYDSLAEAYETAGELKAAKENYGQAAKIGKETGDPNLAIYQQNLARVTNLLATREVSRLGGKLEMEGDVVVKVDLSETAVKDEDLDFLHGMTSLRYLDLRRTGVTDKATEYIGDLQSLETLNFFRTTLSDVGLARIGRLTTLRTLFIGTTAISDAGLAHLAALKNLRKMSLFRTGITDAGLTHLQSLPKLEVLLIGGSKVTEDAARAALPSVRFTEQT